MVSLALPARISRTRVEPELLDRARRPCRRPRPRRARAWPSSAAQSASVSAVLSPEQRLHGVGAAAWPCASAQAGLTPSRERQRLAGLDPRQREAGDLRAGDGQVLGGEGEVLLLLAVQRVDGARVEGGQPAAREVVVHLGLDRLDGGGGGGGGVAQRQHGRVGFGLLPPIGVGLRLGEELVHLGLVDAGLAAAVGLRAEAGDDVVDDRLGGVVLGGLGG